MPDGFCEDVSVYWWNKRILEQLHAGATEFVLPDELAMRELFTHVPYALKDPAFSWTYPAWKPLLVQPNVCLVLFRDPISFAKSALRLKQDVSTITASFDELLEAWAGTIENVFALDDGTFHYIHYQTIIDGSVFPYLENLLGYPIVRDFVRHEFIHPEAHECPKEQMASYTEIMRRMVHPAGLPPATNDSEDRRASNCATGAFTF